MESLTNGTTTLRSPCFAIAASASRLSVALVNWSPYENARNNFLRLALLCGVLMVGVMFRPLPAPPCFTDTNTSAINSLTVGLEIQAAVHNRTTTTKMVESFLKDNILGNVFMLFEAVTEKLLMFTAAWY